MQASQSTSQAGSGVRYWCHECRRHIVIPQGTVEPLCPRCNGGFIEEAGEEAEPDMGVHARASPFGNAYSIQFNGNGAADIFQLLGSVLQGVPAQPPRAPGAPAGGHPPQPREGEPPPHAPAPGQAPGLVQGPPMPFLNIFQQLLQGFGPGGGDPFGDGFPGGLFNFPGLSVQLGGHGSLDNILTHIMNTYTGPIGTPPAAKAVIDGLPRLSGPALAQRVAQAKDTKIECAVCKDEFETADPKAVAVELPCRHLYHSDCILPWLQQHNSCPVCRFELQTDDPDYEARRAAGGGAPQPAARPRPGNSA